MRSQSSIITSIQNAMSHRCYVDSILRMLSGCVDHSSAFRGYRAIKIHYFIPLIYKITPWLSFRTSSTRFSPAEPRYGSRTISRSRGRPSFSRPGAALAVRFSLRLFSDSTYGCWHVDIVAVRRMEHSLLDACRTSGGCHAGSVRRRSGPTPLGFVTTHAGIPVSRCVGP